MKIVLLFWCVSASVYAQYDTIYVGSTTTINMVFESRIEKHHLGSGTVLDDQGKPIEEVLIEYTTGEERMALSALVDEFEPTNLFVQTENAFYNFILVFKAWPSKQFIEVTLDDAASRRKGKEKEVAKATEQKVMVEKKGLAQRDSMVMLAKEVYDKASIRNPDIGIIDQDMVFYLNGIYVSGEYLLVRLNIKNEGTIKYDIGFEGFYFRSEGGPSRKKKAVESEELIAPLYVFNDGIRTVGSKDELSKVFVFSKFTLAKEKYLGIEVWESVQKGQRKIELRVNDKELLKAKEL